MNKPWGVFAVIALAASFHTSELLAQDASSADPIADLFTNGDSEQNQSSFQQAAPAATQPTYESWDVMRQYPRYDVISEPTGLEVEVPKKTTTKDQHKDEEDEGVTEEHKK